MSKIVRLIGVVMRWWWGNTKQTFVCLSASYVVKMVSLGESPLGHRDKLSWQFGRVGHRLGLQIKKTLDVDYIQREFDSSNY